MATLLQVGLHHVNCMCPAQIPGAARHGPAGVGLAPLLGWVCCAVAAAACYHGQSSHTLRRLLGTHTDVVLCIYSTDLRSPRLPLLILAFLLPLHCLQDIRDVTDVPVEKQAARASADSTDTDQKMDQGPAKSDSTNGVGLVSNAAPLTVSSNHHFSSRAVFQGMAAGSCSCLLTPSAQWEDSTARSST